MAIAAPRLQVRPRGRGLSARNFLLILLLGLLPASVGAAPGAKAGSLPSEGRIDPAALEELAARGQANLFVKMTADPDLGMAARISDRAQRLWYVYEVLTEQTARSQTAIRAVLDGQGVRYQPFWINNSLYVYEVDLALAQSLAQRGDVAYLRADRRVPVPAPIAREASEASSAAIEWGLLQIRADEVWAAGNTGEGVVVANIDTGVRYTHEALVDRYRGNNGDGTFTHDYNWWDPDLSYPAPTDGDGHGTHTMGTIVGGDGFGPLVNDIGVAPGARWIAAQGCDGAFCSDLDLISSAQWIACPTRVDGSDPDCGMAPHVVNNSWAGLGGDNWYQSYVNSWQAAGIVPVFSIGSSGPACNTASSPGDYRNVIGVAATDRNDIAASFSSRGPGVFRKLKPDLVAPGVEVRSSYNTSDTAYLIFSGTSMSVPHVVGTIALILSAHPGATYRDVYSALSSTAVQSLGDPPNPDSCGGRRYDEYPNAIYGWGRIDAAAAVGVLSP